MKEINSSYKSLQNQVEDLVYTLNLDFDEINNLGKRQKRILDSLDTKNPWLSFYKKHSKTNRDILFVLLLAKYLDQTQYLYDLSKNVFKKAMEDSIDRLPFKTPYLEDYLLFASVLGYSYEEYLNSLALTNAQETTKTIITALQTQQPIQLDKLVEKQRKRILSINEDKHSGVLHDTTIKVANESYVAPLKNENHRVKFVAIEDNRTTKMCNSMDGMIFNTKDRNSFDRETSTGLKHYEIDGLVSGINLPPITSFVHHCRSWVEYID